MPKEPLGGTGIGSSVVLSVVFVLSTVVSVLSIVVSVLSGEELAVLCGSGICGSGSGRATLCELETVLDDDVCVLVLVELFGFFVLDDFDEVDVFDDVVCAVLADDTDAEDAVLSTIISDGISVFSPQPPSIHTANASESAAMVILFIVFPHLFPFISLLYLKP